MTFLVVCLRFVGPHPESVKIQTVVPPFRQIELLLPLTHEDRFWKLLTDIARDTDPTEFSIPQLLSSISRAFTPRSAGITSQSGPIVAKVHLARP
jgi:hypothetical protein